MNRRVIWLLLAAAFLAVSIAHPEASTPRFWLTSTQADLLKGQVERLSIDDQGRLVLGPALTTVFEATTPFIWVLAAAPDGALYAGGGNDGQVWRVDREGRSAVFFDAPELEVHALAVGADGTLYVGTSPDGKVYKVGAGGTSSVFFDPPDKYIWALAFDAQGRLAVATGDKGVVYRVTPDGKSEVVCQTRATHATSVLFDRQGQLLIGTETPGRVLRVSPAGKAFVLLDSPYRELRGLHVDSSGTVYAVAVDGKPAAQEQPPAQAAEPPKPAPTASVSTEITAVTVIDMPTVTGGPAPPPRATPAAAKGAVYRIDAGGGSDIIWESKDDQPFDLVIEEDGGVLVATGSAGKLYRLSGDPTRATLVARLSGQQVTASVFAGGARYFATSNPARIVKVDARRAGEGQYLSETRDAGTVAAWGTLAWRAVAASPDRVQVFTRAGNTPTPDDTWSDWSGAYQHPDGDAVTSPAARYFQWKAVLRQLAGDRTPPALVSLSVAYLQRNLRPRIASITVNPPGVVYQKPYPTGEPEIAGMGDAPGESRAPMYSFPLGAGGASPSSGPALGRRMYQKGLQTFVWRSDDANDDRLQYDVSYRATDDSTWHVLRRAMEDQILTWDTTSVPDGTYLIKVSASDAASNVPGAGLVGELESDAFNVDNGAPSITILQIVTDGAATRVVFEVRDTQSAISTAEYSVDAGRWQTAYPADGAADSRVERFEIRVEGDAVGRVVIRASDVMNNAATARVERPARQTSR